MEDIFSYAWVLLIVGGVVLFPYVVLPFVIRRTVTQQIDPDLVPFPPDHPTLPVDVSFHFRSAIRQLGGVGFEVLSGFGLPRQMPNVKAVLVLFTNRATRDMAMATAIYADLPEGNQLQSFYVEIVARCHNGTVVQTNNSSQLSAFPTRKPTYTSQFPEVRDAARLFRIHTALANKYGGDSEQFLRLDEEFGGDARAYLAAALREELDAQIATDYMCRREQEGVYRPTWKGAFLMSWQELFPFKQIRLARRDRKAKILLAELEARGELDDVTPG